MGRNNVQIIEKIPLSVKIGIVGEFLGRIGMGMSGLYLIFYLLEKFDSLYYYPVILLFFLGMSLLGGILAGLQFGKKKKSILAFATFLSGLIMLLFSSILLDSIFGILILDALIGFILGVINPTFIAHISKVTINKSQNKSYAFYKGANILGQNCGGIVAGIILIAFFNNLSSLVSLKTIIIVAYSLIGIQALIFILIRTNKTNESFQEECLSINIKNNKKSENLNQTYSAQTKWIILIGILLTSFGIGTSYAYIPLFINENYLISISLIGIFLSIVGFLSGLSTIIGSKILNKWNNRSFLAFSDIFFGISGILILFFPPLLLLFLLLLFRDIISSITSPIVQIILMGSIDPEKKEFWSSIGWLISIFIELIGSMVAVFILESFNFFILFFLSGLAFISAGVIIYSGTRQNRQIS